MTVFFNNTAIQNRKYFIFQCSVNDNVWFQKISMPPSQRVIGNSEGEGEGSQRPKFLKESISLR